MSSKKELTKRQIIKVGVIINYGKDNAKVISEVLKSENTEEKLENIPHILDLNLPPDKKLFIIQKLLSYPKSIRLSISSQIDKKLNKDSVNENNN